MIPIGFSDVEEKIMDKIVNAHNLYMSLEKQHPTDITEWINAIHILQHLLGMRILNREHPDIFPIKEDKE